VSVGAYISISGSLQFRRAVLRLISVWTLETKWLYDVQGRVVPTNTRSK
jgi:hypothetical protein